MVRRPGERRKNTAIQGWEFFEAEYGPGQYHRARYHGRPSPGSSTEFAGKNQRSLYGKDRKDQLCEEGRINKKITGQVHAGMQRPMIFYEALCGSNKQRRISCR